MENLQFLRIFFHVTRCEVQDFSPPEISALMRICANCNGLTWAGDTCQTINPGWIGGAGCFIERFPTRFEVMLGEFLPNGWLENPRKLGFSRNSESVFFNDFGD